MNEALCVLQTYFRISLYLAYFQSISIFIRIFKYVFFLSFALCNFLVRRLQYFFKKIYFVLPTKSWKNHPKKLHVFFFSAAPTAQNSSVLHFPFINYFIQPSLVGSLITSIESVSCDQIWRDFHLHAPNLLNAMEFSQKIP